MDRNASLLGLFEAMLGLVKNAIENAENQTNGALRKVNRACSSGVKTQLVECISQSYGVCDM